MSGSPSFEEFRLDEQGTTGEDSQRPAFPNTVCTSHQTRASATKNARSLARSRSMSQPLMTVWCAISRPLSGGRWIGMPVTSPWRWGAFCMGTGQERSPVWHHISLISTTSGASNVGWLPSSEPAFRARACFKVITIGSSPVLRPSTNEGWSNIHWRCSSPGGLRISLLPP